MKLKVCGMKENPEAVAALNPDYLGFIFWEGSNRFFEDVPPTLNPQIQKVGVFVNAPQQEILDKVQQHGLQGVQLHGSESAPFCESLKNALPKEVALINVFLVSDGFDFDILATYEDVCDYYLFDAKGKLPGGNGLVFNWSLLNSYPSKKPFFLSGGIGLEAWEDLEEFLASEASRYCHGIDVNSKFEQAPGLKDIEKLEAFIKKIR